MGKVHLPYVQRVVSKGRAYYRYRRNGQLIALPPDPTSHEFAEAYNRIHASFDDTRDEFAILPDSISALCANYKASAEFKSLKPRVQKLYLSAIDIIHDRLGKFPAKKLTRNVARELRDSFADTPAKANNIMSVLKVVYSFATEYEILKENPVDGLKKIKVGKWRAWTQSEVDQFLKAAPMHMKLALALGLYTGQRRGDIIAMRWNHIEDSGVNVVQEKTGTRVWIPIHKNLRRIIKEAKDAKKADDAANKLKNKPIRPDTVTILASAKGLPYTAYNLSHKFKDACRAANLPEDCVFHGLRKRAAVMLAEAGCSNEQIKAITGHKTDEMVTHYVEDANQKVLAKEAVRILERSRPKNVQPIRK